MKTATALYHRRAEQTGIVRDILKKQVSRQAYTLYLRNLYFIYTGLEKPLEHSSDGFKVVMPFLSKNVQRSGPLSQDLYYLSGPKDWHNLPLLQTSVSYREHIDHIRMHAPVLLLGHIYVRYLGDMNGGQVLHKLLSNTLRLPDESLNFHQYPAILQIQSFRQVYRNLFNTADLSALQRREVIETSIQAFEFNIALSEEIKAFFGSAE